MPTTLISAAALAAELANPHWAGRRLPLRSAAPRVAARGLPRRPHPGRGLRATSIGTCPVRVGTGTGRHPLPAAAGASRRRSAAGASMPATQVVAYDQANGAYAARLWWMLRWLGHIAACGTRRRIRGLGARPACRRSAEAEPARRRALRRRACIREMAASGAQIVAGAASGHWPVARSLLVDARGADRFAGENETLDPVAGHVPGALNHPFARQSRRRRPLPRCGAAARSAGSRRSPAAAPGDGRGHVRLRRHRLPQPAGAGGRRPTRRAPLRRLLERMDHRSGAPGRARPVTTRKRHAQF